MIIKEEIKKGTIIEVKVPNVENPIKALVLDITRFNLLYKIEGLSLICYAQKRLFKVSCKYKYKTPEVGKYYDFEYEGIIVDYCEIPNIPT